MAASHVSGVKRNGLILDGCWVTSLGWH